MPTTTSSPDTPSLPPSFATDSALAEHVVRTAGSVAQRMRAHGLNIDTKSSISDVVTEADKAAEDYIANTLHTCCPEDALFGEEGATVRGTSGRRWTIDPVDGTYNFAHHSDYWCSAVALTDPDPLPCDKLDQHNRYQTPSSEVTLGAVYRPCTESLWVGGPDTPTTFNGELLLPFAERPHKLAPDLAHACLLTYLHPTFFQQEHIAQAWLRVTSRTATYRMKGSASVDLAGVAQGTADLWMQHRLPDWDRLPGAALVLGVGGDVQDVMVEGEVWTVAGASHLVAEAVEALRSL